MGKANRSSPTPQRSVSPPHVVLADKVLTCLQTRDLLSIFKPESVKQAQREKEEADREAAKVLFQPLAHCRPSTFFF